MRVKRITIKSLNEIDKTAKTWVKTFERGKFDKHICPDYFDSLDSIRSILTEKRLELWRIVRDRQPNSISALATLSKRGFRGVYRDLLILKDVGLVSLRKTKGKRGDLSTPISLADELIVKVA